MSNSHKGFTTVPVVVMLQENCRCGDFSAKSPQMLFVNVLLELVCCVKLMELAGHSKPMGLPIIKHKMKVIMSRNVHKS